MSGKTLLLLATLIMMKLSCYSSTISTDSIKVAISDLSRINVALVHLDACEQRDTFFRVQIDSFTSLYNNCQKAFRHSDTTIFQQAIALSNCDSIRNDQVQKIGNLKQIMIDKDGLARWKTIGFTIGGFTLGFLIAIPVTYLLVHH